MKLAWVILHYLLNLSGILVFEKSDRIVSLIKSSFFTFLFRNLSAVNLTCNTVNLIFFEIQVNFINFA